MTAHGTAPQSLVSLPFVAMASLSQESPATTEPITESPEIHALQIALGSNARAVMGLQSGQKSVTMVISMAPSGQSALPNANGRRIVVTLTHLVAVMELSSGLRPVTWDG
jgi:hypothetical protein